MSTKHNRQVRIAGSSKSSARTERPARTLDKGKPGGLTDGGGPAPTSVNKGKPSGDTTPDGPLAEGVDYGRHRPKLTLAQHREIAKLGIAWRPVDATWGFKLKCSRRACQNTVKTCYCEVDLAEAIRRVKEDRSGYACGDECWILNGDAEACADDSEEEFEHFVSRSRMKRYGISFSEGGWVAKAYNTPQLKGPVQDFLSELKSNMDYDGDEGECSCEI